VDYPCFGTYCLGHGSLRSGGILDLLIVSGFLVHWPASSWSENQKKEGAHNQAQGNAGASATFTPSAQYGFYFLTNDGTFITEFDQNSATTYGSAFFQ
jgi:hypothetical protein